MFGAPTEEISADNILALEAVGDLDGFGTTRFDASGEWIFATSHYRLVGFNVKSRRRQLLLEAEPRCTLTPSDRLHRPIVCPMDSTLCALATSPDGRYLATQWDHGSYEGLVVWDLDSGERLATFNPLAGNIVLRFSPDSQSLYYDFSTGGLWHYDVNTNRTSQISNETMIYQAMVADVVYVQTNLGVLRVDGDSVESIATTANIPSRAFVSPDGRYLIGQDPNTFEVTRFDWREQSGLSLGIYNTFIDSVAFSPDNELVAVADYGGAVTVRELQTGRERFTWDGSFSSTHSLAFTNDSSMLLASSYINLTGLDTQTGRELGRVRTSLSNYDIQLSPDGRYLLLGNGRVFAVR